MSKLKTGLALIDRGMAVFICIANKKAPLTKRGFLDATRDPKVVRAWLTAYPTANIAVATGAISGVVVVDTDVTKGKNGEAELAALEEKFGKIPPTVESITPSGGRHTWFQHPGHPVPSSQGALAPGIDVRGDGGYVLVPPSYVIEPPKGEHEGYAGSYVWSVDCAATIAPMPEWLNAKVVERREPRPEGYFAQFIRGVPDGQRTGARGSLIGKLLQMGVPPADVRDFALWQNERCDPPEDIDVVERHVINIAKREISKRYDNDD